MGLLYMRRPLNLLLVQYLAEGLLGLLAGEEEVVVGGVYVVIPWGDHAALHSHLGHLAEETVQIVNVAAAEYVVFVHTR